MLVCISVDAVVVLASSILAAWRLHYGNDHSLAVPSVQLFFVPAWSIECMFFNKYGSQTELAYSNNYRVYKANNYKQLIWLIMSIY